MPKRKFFKLGMILSHCLWCFIEIYLLLSGKKMNGNSITTEIMESRKKLYCYKSVAEHITIFAYLLDIWISSYKKKSVKDLLCKMISNLLILFLISLLSIIGCSILFPSYGYLNFLEPLYQIILLMIFNLIIFYMYIRKTA